MSYFSQAGTYRLSLPQDFMLVHYVDDIMLTGPCEWEVSYNSRLTGEPFACQTVEGKSDKSLGTFHLCGFSRCPLAWGIPSKVKDICIWPFLQIQQQQRKGTTPNGPLWVLEAACSLECAPQAYLPSGLNRC